MGGYDLTAGARIARITDGNLQNVDGLWCASSEGRVSYPEAGNEACFQVEDTSFWFQHRNAIITTLLSGLKFHGVFLDIGGGNGFVAAAIQELGIDVVLLEPGKAGARNALRRGIRDVLNCTLADAGILDASLSGVGVFDVVEHIEEDANFLKQIHRLLKPEGLLVATVPAFRSLWSYEDVHAGHYRRYTLREFAQLLKTAGFEIEYMSYIFQPLYLPILLLRALPTQLGLRSRVEPSVTAKEHSLPDSLVGKHIGRSLRRELHRISQLKCQSIGSSCLVAARKAY